MIRLRSFLYPLALSCIVTSLSAAAQPAPSPPVKLVVHSLRGGAYWLEGGRANTGFIVGKTGVIVFDAQMTADAVAQEMAAIAEITPRSVNQIIVSHADPDHVAGLPLYPAGIPIIAQENAKSEILASAADPKGGPLTAVYKRLVGLPYQTVGNGETVTIDGVAMKLMYVAPAHTSGDLILYLPTEKLVYGGDIILTETSRFPVIHLGGSSLGWVAAMKAILALDADLYVPGHGMVETKSQLRDRLRDVEERRSAIKTMVDAGKTLPEVEAALPEPGVNPMFLSFTQTVYKELTDGYPPASPPWTNLVHRAQ